MAFKLSLKHILFTDHQRGPVHVSCLSNACHLSAGQLQSSRWENWEKPKDRAESETKRKRAGPQGLPADYLCKLLPYPTGRRGLSLLETRDQLGSLLATYNTSLPKTRNTFQRDRDGKSPRSQSPCYFFYSENKSFRFFFHRKCAICWLFRIQMCKKPQVV